MSSLRQPTLFISHGGGPWPYIPETKALFAKTVQWLSNLPKTLPEKPKAILSISGHWEEENFTVSTASKPPMIYDYGGFPEHTYSVQYPAPGSPEVACHVRNLLGDFNIKCEMDPTHGFDHGTFVPLVLMFPEADVPVISMSMKSNYDPKEHLRMGEALKPLRDQGILIIGSGLTYHNMRGFRTPGADTVSKQFGQWLGNALKNPNAEIRNQQLIHWEQAPAARQAHPREDHLIPAMVVAGAAGSDPVTDEFIDHVMAVDMASYRFA